MNEFKKYETKKAPMAGECISNYALALIAEADDAREMRMALFNECPVIAFPGESAYEVEHRWKYLFREQGDARSRTPVAKEQAAKWAKTQAEHRKVAESLIAIMEQSDLTNLTAAMQAVEQSHVLGYTYTVDLAQRFVSLLASAGYEPNANTGDAYDAEDRENAARYVIGQAMTMPGHGIEGKFCKEWREKFEVSHDSI